MILEKFIEQRPYLYHLTSLENAQKIIVQKKIFSANKLIDLADNPEYIKIKRERRVGHKEIIIGDEAYQLRDQRPISELVLSKCLTNNWKVPDFLYYLNNRVFMWPTQNRLIRHFNRYENENPIIFRFSSLELIEINKQPKFCRLNSGATRANSYLGGKAPERGRDSFLLANDYPFAIGSVAEVTFENECNVDTNIYYSTKPDGIFLLAK